jgi:hypothetical protein
MSDSFRPPLRAVDPTDRPPIRRGPGAAVIAVAIYAFLFMGALWFFKRHRSPVLAPRPRAIPAVFDRASLLDGVGLSPVARDAYLLRLGSDRCDCGCDMTLRACLTRDRTCVRSPELAGERMRASLAAPRP